MDDDVDVDDDVDDTPAATDDDDADGDEINAAAYDGWWCCCWANVILDADVAAVTLTLHISDTMAIVIANISTILDVVRIIRDVLKLLFIRPNRLNSVAALNSFPCLNSPANREK